MSQSDCPFVQFGFSSKPIGEHVRRYKIIHNFHYIKKFLLNIKFHQGVRMISSRLKYSRNALCINALPFARYFRQRFAPFFRHRRRSQGYPY